MSLLCRRQLNIVLGPGQIALQRMAYKLTAKGRAVDVLGEEVIPSAPEGKAPWSGALEALAGALPRLVWRDMWAKVILSNHFVQYALIPRVGNLSEEDEAAYARHCFREVYGDAAEVWEIRVSPSERDGPGLASAVDGALLGELRELLTHAGVKTKSIQPRLMAAFNGCRGLQGRTAWLALLEPGSVCLAMLQRGQFSWIRKLRIGDSWQEELPGLLEREAYFVDGGADAKDVFLWGEDVEGGHAPPTGRWNWSIQRLQSFAQAEKAGAE